MRFDCPACGAVLTVPAAAAGIQGPCPKCWQEIVSPDPAKGLPARLPAIPPQAASTPEPAVPEPVVHEPVVSEPVVPEPVVPEPAVPAPRERRRGRWLVPTLLSGLIFTGIGYHLGKGQRPVAIEPANTTPPAPPTPQEPVAPPAPAPPTPNPTPPPPSPLPEVLDQPDAEAALRSFLEAPDWQARGRHVLSPNEVLPAMEKHAAEHGDGPIATTTVKLLEVAGITHIFKVCTPAIPEGFPVAVTGTDEGPMIDWDSFIGFHEDRFRKFLEAEPGPAAAFDLLVKPEAETEEDKASHFLRYRLTVPMPDREVVAWVRKDSAALAKLRAIFDGSGGFDEETITRLSDTGVPLTLTLAKRATNDGKTFVEIEEFRSVGWGPAPP